MNSRMKLNFKFIAASHVSKVQQVVDNFQLSCPQFEWSQMFPFFIAVSDFTDTLAQVYEKHAEELQVVVSNFRKKNGELRKEVSVTRLCVRLEIKLSIHSVLLANRHCSMHGKLFCRKSKPIPNQQVNCQIYYRNKWVISRFNGSLLWVKLRIISRLRVIWRMGLIFTTITFVQWG